MFITIVAIDDNSRLPLHRPIPSTEVGGASAQTRCDSGTLGPAMKSAVKRKSTEPV